MRWPTTKAESEYLAGRQRQNRARNPKAEAWALEKLRATRLKWTQQALWGYRIFDFWNATRGVAVEIDGPEHDREYDAARDRYNFERSGIIVYRVPNFDEARMTEVINLISHTDEWKARRARMDLKAAKRARSGKDKLKAGV